MTEGSIRLRSRLDAALAGLGPGVVLAHHRSQRLVVAAAGIFVLDPTSESLAANGREAAQLAHDTREALAGKLRWVPFVDWYAVGDADPGTHLLPVDMVDSIVDGGHVVDEATVHRIGALLSLGELTPPWYPGLPA